MKATVLVRPKPGILDPQGQAVEASLRQLGFSVGDARIGRVVDLVRRMRQHLTALDFHQRAGHDQEIADEVQVQKLQDFEKFQELIGDAGEYLVMARNLGHLDKPSLTPGQLKEARTIVPGDAGVRLEKPWLRGPDGRQDLPHFWFYSFLAAPFVSYH